MPCGGPSASVGRDGRGCVSARKHVYGHHLLLAFPSTSSPKAACSLPCPPEERGSVEPCPALLQCHGAITTVHQPEREEKE